MTIDEAISHCLEVAEENEELSSKFDEWDDWEKADADNCRRCAADHRQLAEWLTELKVAKRLLKSAATVLGMFLPCDEDYNCSECIKQRQNCAYDDSFKWRYLEEARALIGEENDHE